MFPAPEDARRRRKVIFNVAEQNGRPVAGFYRARSHDVVPVPDCPAVPKESLICARTVLGWMEREHIPVYDETAKRDGVRHIFFRSSHLTENAVLTLTASRSPGEKALGILADMLRERCPEVTGLVLNRNTARGNTVLAGEFTTVWGSDILTEGLCGRTRPTHFRGVCTVVSKLMNIVTPDRAYFGQKDAQQLAVIRRMVRDLNMDVEVIGCPIVRETDGLAKSSRNTYLSADERRSALVLSRAVFAGEKLVREGERDADAVVRAMRGVIEAEPAARIDYVEAVDADAVTPVTRIEGRVLFAMAVYIGKTRLIDNFIAQI